MRLSRLLLKWVANQTYFKRNDFILVDNTMNKQAELTDNFALFEYLQSKSEYKDNSYYVINRDSVQYKEIVAKYPHKIIAVKHGQLSLKLIYRLIFAKYWIDAYQVISAFDPFAYITDGKITTVYAQHGINYFKTGFIGNIAISPRYFNKIIFSNHDEERLYKRYYNYNAKNVIMGGLSRWDLIKTDVEEKSIFVYFTQRTYIKMMQSDDIVNTRYYKAINELLNSQMFNELLKKHNVKVYAGIHHQMMRNERVRESLDNIHFIEDKDIGAIKQKASMLITDFSSMCFDFMIKDKPVIFYHLDHGDELIKMSGDSLENEETAESKNDEVYNVFYTLEDTLSAVKYYLENDFILEPEKKKKNDKFFTYRSDIRKHIMDNLLSSPENIENSLYPADLSYLCPINFGNELKYSNMYVFGFAQPEDWGYWSIGKECYMAFKVSEKKNFELLFDCMAYVNGKHKKLSASVYINDSKKANWVFERKKDTGILKISVSADDLDSDNVCRVIFKIDNPASPKELGKGDDTRKLGIGIRSVRIEG